MAGHDTCAGGNLEYARERSGRQTPCEICSIWLEDQRDEKLLIEFRNRAGEGLVRFGGIHRSLLRNAASNVRNSAQIPATVIIGRSFHRDAGGLPDRNADRIELVKTKHIDAELVG